MWRQCGTPPGRSLQLSKIPVWSRKYWSILDWMRQAIHRTAHRRQIWPTNKRHYSEFQRIDYTSVRVAIGRSLDSGANSPSFRSLNMCLDQSKGTAGYPQGSEYFSESRKRVVIRPNPLKRNASLSFTEKIATILEKDNETTLFAGM